MELWGQIISLIGMVAIILSWQCKSNRNLVIVIGTGALLFAISYFLLGQPSAAMFNLIAVICSVSCLNKKTKSKLTFAIIVLLYIIAICFAFEGWWSFVFVAAQIAGSYAVMFRSGKFIRNMRFFFVSPVWLINNTLICFSLGGTICEIITMASIVVSFIRYRKTGFEE